MRRVFLRLACCGVAAAGAAIVACADLGERVLICDVAKDDPVALLINTRTRSATLLSEDPQRTGRASISPGEYDVEFPGSGETDPIVFRIERFGGKGSRHIEDTSDGSTEIHTIECHGEGGAELL